MRYKITTNKTRLAVVTVLLTLSSVAMSNPIKGEGELSATFSNGNTDTQNLAAKLKLSKKMGAWFNEAGLSATNSADTNSTTAERYLITGKTGRDITNKLYAFGSGKYDKDLFSGFDHQATFAAGLGMHVIKSDRVTLDIEAGPGFRLSETNAGVEQDEAVLHIGLNYKNKITDTTHISQNLTIEAGSDNTSTDSETAITVKMSDALALKASLSVKNNTDVPVGTEKTDTVTGLSLIYGF